MKETIFFVEDDISINQLLKATLDVSGYNSQGFLYPLEFLQAVEITVPDLIVLDLMLPQMSGYEILQRLQNDQRLCKVPVIMLSALSEEEDIVKGLDNGAVDYITKPFGVNEFISRVKANLRKIGTRENEVLKVREIVIDKTKFTCTVKGKQLQLTAKEFELLSLLVENKSRVVSRSQLLRDIWGFDGDVETRTLDMHIKTIREKLSNAGGDPYIVTVRSVGYAIYDEE